MGYIVPGPREPGRVQVFALSFGVAPRGVFKLAPDFGQMMGLKLSEDRFFFALHLILGKNRTKFE